MKLVFSIIAIVSFAILSSAVPVTTVETDIAEIANEVTEFSKAIVTFQQAGGVANALAIHTEATNLAIFNVSPKPVSEGDGLTILGQVEAFLPTIISSLSTIIAEKAAFEALPIGAVAEQIKIDISTLNTTFSAFENALISIVPSDLQPQATMIMQDLVEKFASAIAAYADVPPPASV